GALAGVAGGLHVVALNGVHIGTYAPSLSFEAFSMVVVGGLTSVWGAILGAMALRYAQYFVTGGLQLIVTGAGVLVLLLVFPGGLGEGALRVRRRALERVARRRGFTDHGPHRADDGALFEGVLSEASGGSGAEPSGGDDDGPTARPEPAFVHRDTAERERRSGGADGQGVGPFLSARGRAGGCGSPRVLVGGGRGVGRG